MYGKYSPLISRAGLPAITLFVSTFLVTTDPATITPLFQMDVGLSYYQIFLESLLSILLIIN
ncbi:hypothetical protein PspMM1_01250 [Pseudoalteromonas sp. MM1]|nr:hypothetical protein PspMM1_01250 [Pseudoalteromonas sp. MM1]